MKLLVVDDHAMIRAGLRQLCADDPVWQAAIILEAQEGALALMLQKKERPQITVLDLNLPGIGGLELLRQILAEDPAARVLVFSMHSEPVYAARALEIGARGYLSKHASPVELRTALARIASGLTYVESEIAQALAAQAGEPRQMLSERDLEILRMLGEGRSFAQIASALGLGYKTVANSATAIKSKLGVARTADLIRLSVEMGIGRSAP
ncbi:MAG: DNA-binding response regulator [Alphaproteobacteria bacterium 64-11]|nr:response regulator transcription factor [Alphaproteobacteria bacterium]OJU11445.1 MAG: DNA-binding response regulator [Alphaproteobacteria bacterium 64-11]